MPRGSSPEELKKKREKLFTRVESATGRTKNSNNKSVVENKKTGKTVNKKKPTKAQELAKKNIKKYGGTAKAAAANKAAMRLKIKKKYLASKKK